LTRQIFRLPFPVALQEFKVETSSLTAQNGYHSAAAVNAVVRSGTNEFHGNLFEFFRNGKLNARNFFAARRDTVKRNQYGGTIGGLIVRGKDHSTCDEGSLLIGGSIKFLARPTFSCRIDPNGDRPASARGRVKFLMFFPF
jgi:hypothetical protein